MKIVLVETTGELEAALELVKFGLNAVVVDFSPNSAMIRNTYIAKNLYNGARYIKIPKIQKTFIKFIALLSFNMVVSLNSYPSMTRTKKIIFSFFRVSYIRDALVPRKARRAYSRLYCESYNKNFYPDSKLIILNADEGECLLQRVIGASIKTQEKVRFSCIIIGKSMRRTAQGSELKRKLYDVISRKFPARIGLIPHPRESEQELALAKLFGIEILDYPIYMSHFFSDQIFVICGSSAEIFDKMSIYYYWVCFDEEFIYPTRAVNEKSRFVKAIFKEISLLESYDFHWTTD